MSERTRNGKTFAQDALGFLFILVGGFFAVSIVLFLRGQEPSEGMLGGITWPVVELVALLGSMAALLLSAGLAALGTLLFLRPVSLAAQRPLTALLAWSLGTALIVGAFGAGGELGAWLPGLVVGFAGRALAVVLGLALAWLGWTFLLAPPARITSSADAVQRIGLAARHDAAAGVSPAEAALLSSEPRASGARPTQPREKPAILRDETIRPYVPARGIPGAEARAKRVEAPVAIPRAPAEARPIAPAPEPVRSASVGGPSAAPVTPPVPSWENLREEAPEESRAGDAEADEETGAAAGWNAAPHATAPAPALAELEEPEERAEESLDSLPEELAEAFDTEDALASELEDEEPASAPPGAAWEQIELFDEALEEEELEADEDVARPKPVKVELTPSFDFDSAEPRRPSHEPEPSEEDPFAGPEAHVAPGDPLAEGAEEARAVPAPRPDFLLKPAPRPEPVVAHEADDGPLEGERWSQLVFDAGCAILEQKRVAVSMLERRFGIDFDQACRVLDELQQAGLIGPYMGGRTRDILLSREQWLPHAPHAR